MKFPAYLFASTAAVGSVVFWAVYGHNLTYEVSLGGDWFAEDFSTQGNIIISLITGVLLGIVALGLRSIYIVFRLFFKNLVSPKNQNHADEYHRV